MQLSALMPPKNERDPDSLYEVFTDWAAGQGITLYPHQDEAIVDILAGANTIIATPTGSGKSLIATGAHFAVLAKEKGRSYYTAPIKALVSEKFFSLCDIFGASNVGMITGDASVNPDAPIVCCTAEILANLALREGENADVSQVVMDEFHFLADPDRGWAWQTGLVELPQAQFIIMSATLGDVTELSEQISDRTGRPTTVIADAPRPVPLVYRWSEEPIHATINTIVADKQAPVYVVHSTQAAANDRAQALLSENLVSKQRKREIVEALGHFKFSAGFGKVLQKLIKSGIGVHHAGMLPRYRRLVETLAQQGLLAVICGTDTLGVGINVPIRCVLFTELTKFDGRRRRVLRSREFHQIAGRAGRAGFDSVGYVVAQAPEHEVENAKLFAKAGDDPKKLKRIRRKKPPEGFINYTEETFNKLINSEPEKLYARIRVTHSTLLNLLERDQDTGEALVSLIDSCTFDSAIRRRLIVRAVQFGKSLLEAGVVTRLDEPTPGGRKYALALDLQHDFALNQPLSAFAVAAINLLDPDSPTYTHDVVSVIESTLEDPHVILRAQQSKEKGEVVAELKADGVEYEERMEILEDVTYPMPLADELEDTYLAFQKTHPWLVESVLSPKSIVREMYEKAMTFSEYVAFHKVQRVEGLLLRYLTDAYRALRQTVPETARTEEFEDLLSWLGEVVRMTDSSLIDEWEDLLNPEEESESASAAPQRTVTTNIRAFRVLVRNAMFRRVELCADDDVEGLEALAEGDPDAFITFDYWDDALADYWDEYDDLLTGAQARSPEMFVVHERFDHFGNRTWAVRQIIDDPEGNHDWSLEATVDLEACDEVDELIIHDYGLTDEPTPLEELGL